MLELLPNVQRIDSHTARFTVQDMDGVRAVVAWEDSALPTKETTCR